MFRIFYRESVYGKGSGYPDQFERLAFLCRAALAALQTEQAHMLSALEDGRGRLNAMRAELIDTFADVTGDGRKDLIQLAPNRLRVSKWTPKGYRKIKQNLFWAFFYNVLGIPLAAGLFYPLWGLYLKPEFAGLAMAQSGTLAVPFAPPAPNGALHYQRALLYLAAIDEDELEEVEEVDEDQQIEDIELDEDEELEPDT